MTNLHVANICIDTRLTIGSNFTKVGCSWLVCKKQNKARYHILLVNRISTDFKAWVSFEA